MLTRRNHELKARSLESLILGRGKGGTVGDALPGRIIGCVREKGVEFERADPVARAGSHPLRRVTYVTICFIRCFRNSEISVPISPTTKGSFVAFRTARFALHLIRCPAVSRQLSDGVLAFCMSRSGRFRN